jgi:hypothetical protein
MYPHLFQNVSSSNKKPPLFVLSDYKEFVLKEVTLKGTIDGMAFGLCPSTLWTILDVALCNTYILGIFPYSDYRTPISASLYHILIDASIQVNDTNN